jgi:hypothetical protein
MMMASDPRSVDFWTPVTYKPFVANTWKESLLESAERYLSLSGKKLSVVPLGSRDQVVTYQESVNYWVTALKVASYFTFVLPAIAFAIKYALRPHFYYYEQTHVSADPTVDTLPPDSGPSSRDPILNPNKVYTLTAEQVLPHRIRIANSFVARSDKVWRDGVHVFCGVSDRPHYARSEFQVVYCGRYEKKTDKMVDMHYNVLRFDADHIVE